MAENLDSQIVGVALNRIFQSIGDLLANFESCEINLGQLGKLSALKKEVHFTPSLKTKIANYGNKVRNRCCVGLNVYICEQIYN